MGMGLLEGRETKAKKTTKKTTTTRGEIDTGKLALGLGAGYLLYNAIKNNQQQQNYYNRPPAPAYHYPQPQAPSYYPAPQAPPSYYPAPSRPVYQSAPSQSYPSTTTYYSSSGYRPTTTTYYGRTGQESAPDSKPRLTFGYIPITTDQATYLPIVLDK